MVPSHLAISPVLSSLSRFPCHPPWGWAAGGGEVGSRGTLPGSPSHKQALVFSPRSRLPTAESKEGIISFVNQSPAVLDNSMKNRATKTVFDL